MGVYLQRIEAAVKERDLGEVRSATREYLSSADFHTHVGMVLGGMLLPHEELLDLTAEVVQRSIDANTPEHLSLLSPAMGTARHQRLEFGRLYSLQGWVLWKQGRQAEALGALEKGIDYLQEAPGPTAADKLRLGIVRYMRGKRGTGWGLICEALLMDSQVELGDPGYLEALEPIVGEEARGLSAIEFINVYRAEQAEPLPALGFVTLDGTRTSLGEGDHRATFVGFFSPACGSCRREIPALKALHDRMVGRDDVRMLFVLNQPRRRREAVEMMANAGLADAAVLVVAEGSAYDLIAAEPTVWIADGRDRIRAKHTGYTPGDEQMYERELLQLLAE